MRRSARAALAVLGVVALVVGVALAWQGASTPPADVLDDSEASESAARETTILATRPREPGDLDRAASSPAGTGALAVRVLRAPDRAPVADAPVILRGLDARGAPASRIGWTDDMGRARVDRVPVGAWNVRIQPSADPPVDREAVAIRDGETTVLDDVVLSSVGVVDGMVFDEAREPIADVDVVATLDADVLRGTDDDPWPPTTNVPSVFARLRTDDRGRFRLEGVPPGLVAVRVASAGWRGATDRVLVPPEPPRTGWVRFVLRRGHRIAGTIVGLDGKPVAKTRVDVGSRSRGVFTPRISVETDADGRFGVAGFGALPGADLLVTPPEGAVTAFDGVPLDTDLRLTIGAATGARVRVTVLSAAAKQPIAGALVRLPLRPSAAAAWDVGQVDQETDGYGQATVDVAPGTVFQCEVMHPEWRPAAVRVDRSGRPSTEGLPVAGDVARPLGQDEERGIAVFLRPPLPVRGRVVDQSGTPLRRARVTLAHAVLREPVTALTDGAGRFTFPAAVPEYGPTLVAESPRGVRSAERELEIPAPGDVPWPEVEIRVRQEGGTLEGTVVDAEGRPVAGARVRTEAGLMARTDEAGRYRLVGLWGGPPPAGRSVTLTATAEGVGWAVAPAKVIDGENGTVPPLSLARGVDLRGVVTLPEGDRARFPVLEVRRGAETEPIRISCGEEFGDYVLRALPPGPWIIRARTAGMAGAVGVRLDGPRGPDFTPIRLAPVWEVGVRVVDARTGEPVPGLTVSISAWRGARPPHRDPDPTIERPQAVTGPDGQVALVTQAATPESIHVEFDRAAWKSAKGRRATLYQSGDLDLPARTESVVVEVSDRARPHVRGRPAGSTR